MNRLYFALFLTLGVAAVVVVLTFQYRISKTRSYRIYQDAYYQKAYELAESQELKERFREQGNIPPEDAGRLTRWKFAASDFVNKLFPNIEQNVYENPEWGTVEISRCTTCHTAVENPNFEGGVDITSNKYSDRERRLIENALTYHPDISPHNFTEFSCVSCHGGNPRGLTLADAHGAETEYTYLGDRPVTDERFAIWQNPTYTGDELDTKKYYQSNCVSCHSYPYPEKQGVLSMEQVEKGRELFFDRSCYTCHQISGLSWGQTGPALNTVGSEFRYGYLEQSIWHPRANQDDSKMPYIFSNFELEEEIQSERFHGDYPYSEEYGEDPRRSKAAAQEVYALVTFLLSQRPEDWVTRPRPGVTRDEFMGPPTDRPVPEPGMGQRMQSSESGGESGGQQAEASGGNEQAESGDTGESGTQNGTGNDDQGEGAEQSGNDTEEGQQ